MSGALNVIEARAAYKFRCPIASAKRSPFKCCGDCCMLWRRVRVRSDGAREGYCGLGGIPHELVLPNPPRMEDQP